jgi:hypothetical protein
MFGLYVAIASGASKAPDVGTPQADNLGGLACHSNLLSDMMRADRTQAVFFLHRGLEGTLAFFLSPQERWSRGCPRALVLFWLWLLSARWLPAPRRMKKWLLWSRLRSSPHTPANTSNVSGRSGQLRLNPAAPKLRPQVALPTLPGRFDLFRNLRNATARLSDGVAVMRFLCALVASPPFCWRPMTGRLVPC